MAGKAAYEALEQRVKELEEESARNAQLKERLSLAEQALEKKEQQIEEYFVKANALVMETELARIELNQIFNAATDGMWIVDDQFNVVKINNVLSTLLGKSISDTVSRKCYDLFQGSLCQSDDCPMQLILKGENEVECDIERKSGDTCEFIHPDRVTLPGPGWRFIGHGGELQGYHGEKADSGETAEGESEIKPSHPHRWSDADRQPPAVRRMPETGVGADGTGESCLCPSSCAMWIASNCTMTITAICWAMIVCAPLPGQSIIAPNGPPIWPRVTAGRNSPFFCRIRTRKAPFSSRSRIRMKVQDLMIDHAVSPVHQYVTLSLGVSSVIPEYGANPQTLLEASDSALYEAKRAGRNQVCVKSIGASDQRLHFQKSA